MPFTPSHAVVALALLRTPLVPAAIAVGAMTPDLPLFLRGTPLQYGHTHDLRWLPITVVVALLLLLVWRCALRPAVRELSPTWLAARLPAEWDGSAAAAALRETFPGVMRLLWLILSLLLGVITHVVWDLFTHEGRVGLDLIPALAQQWGPLPGYTWVQHGSSALGMAVLAAWAAIRLVRRRPVPVTRRIPGPVRVAWWCSLPVLLMITWGAGYALTGPFTPAYGPAHLAYLVLPPACALWGLITLALAVVTQAVASRR